MTLPQIFLEGAIRPFSSAPEADVNAVDLKELDEAPSGSIHFDLQPQSQNQWCWAAVAVSVSIHYDASNWTQCELAKSVLHRSTCCQSEPSCDDQAPLSTALETTENLAEGPIPPLDFGEVRDEIDGKRLVCCRMEKSTGHFLVLSGYREEPSDTWVDVQDPWGDTFASMPYDKFLFQHERGPCTHAYRTHPK